MFDPYKIRDDFPILSTTVYGRPLAYLDSGATAQKPRCVIDKVAELMTCSNANIHRGVHHLSERMTSEYERARERVREFIGARSSEEVIFTSGATAAVNTVAYAWSARYLAAGDNILLSEMEHHSDIVPWQLAAERHGAQIRVLPFDDDGRLMTELLPELIDSRTRMVAVTQASNTLGTRPDLDAVISAAHAAGAVVLVDGCQGIVHGGVDVTELGCDFYVFSGHKLYAPTGIGVLYGRRELLESMPPFMGGGDMVDKVTFERTTYAPLPLKYEAGTSDFIGAAALATAMDYLSQFDASEIERHEHVLMMRAEEGLRRIEGLRIYGSCPDKCPIVSFDVEGLHNYDIGMILDKLGVAVRTGHHCAAPVMDHYGISGMCRASIAMYNTAEEIDRLVEGVARAVRMLGR